jgi:hypothetical protein
MAAPDLEEGGIAGALGEANDTVERMAMDAVALGGDRAENIDLGAEEIAPGRLVLGDEAGLDQGEENAPAGRLRQAGGGDDLGEPHAVAGPRRQDAQHDNRAVDALRAGDDLVQARPLAVHSASRQVHMVDFVSLNSSHFQKVIDRMGQRSH